MSQSTGMFNAYMNPTQLNKKSFAATIARIFPNGSAPLFALRGEAGLASAKGILHGYFSKTWTYRNLVTTAVASGATSFVLTAGDTKGLLVNQLFHNMRTREIVRVTAKTDATTIAVDRGFGRVVAAATQTGDQWVQVGTAHSQGSQRPEAKNVQAVWFQNYTQIWRNAWALTDTARATHAEAGWNNGGESRRDCMMFHSEDIETGMFFGQQSIDVSGPQPLHTTQGVIDSIHEYAPTNVFSAASTTSFEQMEDFLVTMFKFNTTGASGQKQRVAFVDSKANKVLQQIGRAQGVQQTTLETNAMGQTFHQFNTYKGSVNIIEHPIFNGMGLNGMMVGIDLPAVKMAYLDGRNTKSEEFVGNDGQDAIGGGLTSEAAMEFVSPFSCCIISGLTAGVK